MTWIKLDAAMLEHPKWLRALRLGGDAALHLWLQLTMWSARYLTDGVIPADVVTSLPGPKGAATLAKAWRALADSTLIERRANGDVVIHDYLDHQRSRAELTADLDRKAHNQRNHRVRRAVTDHAPVDATEVKSGCDSVRSDLDQIRSRSEKRERDPDPDARAPEVSPDELEALRELAPLTVPLGPSKRERERDSGPGTVPAVRYAFREEWDPSHEHRARGLELGLTDEQILERAEHCRRKAYPAGIRSEDDQFFRELMWLRNDLEKTRFKESASARRRFENPGSDRTA